MWLFFLQLHIIRAVPTTIIAVVIVWMDHCLTTTRRLVAALAAVTRSWLWQEQPLWVLLLVAHLGVWLVFILLTISGSIANFMLRMRNRAISWSNNTHWTFYSSEFAIFVFFPFCAIVRYWILFHAFSSWGALSLQPWRLPRYPGHCRNGETKVIGNFVFQSSSKWAMTAASKPDWINKLVLNIKK